MSLNVLHVPYTATWPWKPGFAFSHSNTVTFGLGPKSLALMRESGEPVSISL
jgi:hypothetical protein